MTKQKIKFLLLHCVLLLPFVAVWSFLVQLLAYAEWEGVLSVIPDAFGKGAAIAITVLGVLAATSVIFLPLFIKREWVIQVIAYFLTALFCVIVYVSVIYGDQRFETFSPEAWQEYPARRGDMYASFKEQYKLYGDAVDELIELLGLPDEIFDDGSMFYSSTHNNGIYVEVTDGKVCGIWLSE